MKSVILLPLLIVALLTGCEKEVIEHQLPPYSQEGNNIFACKINGEIYIAEGKYSINSMGNPGSEGVAFFYTLLGNDTIMKLRSKEDNPTKARFYINFKYSKLTSTYELNQYENSVGIVSLPVQNYILAESKFATNSDYKGKIEIKYFQNDVLAGTFEFTAIDTRGEIIHVTEGRFDVSTR